jgi:hypothetical protein
MNKMVEMKEQVVSKQINLFQRMIGWKFQGRKLTVE